MSQQNLDTQKILSTKNDITVNLRFDDIIYKFSKYKGENVCEHLNKIYKKTLNFT